jgi:general secretion pathway protein K
MQSAQQQFDGDRALFMARGAAEIIFANYSKNQTIPSDAPIRQGNHEFVIPFDSGEARVHFESNSGLIDINTASDKLLASMFDSLGLDRDLRNHLVDCILDWRDADDIPHLYGAEVNDYPQTVPGAPATRPRNGDFQTVEELLMVKNMTPEVFYGTFASDPATGAYIRIPGLRELLTVHSGSTNGQVNINIATQAVLAVLPAMDRQLAAEVIAERTAKPFNDATDLLARIPEFIGKETINYLSFDAPQPSALISRATIFSSGISKTVRLLFKRDETVKRVPYPPYHILNSRLVPDRWRID